MSTQNGTNNDVANISSLSNITEIPVARPTYSLPWDNPSNIITKEQSDSILFVLQCFVFPAVTAFGVTGNVISLIVMLQKKLRNSTTSIVLIALAVSDMLFLVFNMARKSTGIIKTFDPDLSAAFSAKNFALLFYTKTAFSRVSGLLVVIISTERLIAVALPLKVRSLVTRSRLLMAVVGCYIATFGFLAVLPAQYTYTYIRGKPYTTQTQFALNNVDALKVYNEYFLPIVFRHIPVLLVLFFNIAIISIVGRSRRFQKNVTKVDAKRAEEHRKLTRLLVSVAIIFLICLIPGDALLITSTVMAGKFSFFGIYHNLFLVVSDFSLLFEMINSSSNFIIYMVLNRNFYQTYIDIFCSWSILRKKQDDKKSSATTETKKSDVVSTPAIAKKLHNISPPSSSGYESSQTRPTDLIEKLDDYGCHDNKAYRETP